MVEALGNIEAEAALLGAILADPRRFDPLADLLVSEDFAEPAHGAIWEMIGDAAATGRSVNALTLHPFAEADPRFRSLGGGAYLFAISSTVSALLDVRAMAEQVAEFAAKRRFIAACRDIADRASEPCTPLSSAVDEFDAAVMAAVSRSDPADACTGSDAAGLAIERIDAIRAGTGNRGAVTGIAEFDQLTGGLEPGSLTLIAARPGVGKTGILVSACNGLTRRGGGALVFSLEMSSRELGFRLLSDELCRPDGSISFARLRDGDLTDDEVERVRTARAALAARPLLIVDRPNLKLSRVGMIARRYARRLAAKGQKLETIWIDYLGLLAGERPGMSAYDRTSEVSRGLKCLAKDLNCAVVALSQLNRAVEGRTDKRPILSDLRDSGQLEQDADAVIFLHREELILRQAEETDPARRPAWEAAMRAAQGRLDLLMPKRRNGPPGTASCVFLTRAQAVRSTAWREA